MVPLCSLLVTWGDSEGGGCVRQEKACLRGHSSSEQGWRGGRQVPGTHLSFVLESWSHRVTHGAALSLKVQLGELASVSS